LFHVGASGGMPNVVMESIVSGLPVIAADGTAANRDLVNEQDGTGILIEIGNKLQLEQAISKILFDDKNNNFKKSDAIKKFSIEKYGKEMSKIFQEIIDQKI
jgi:glycosyltransferase involved in cell wall biosynthesis